MKRTKPNKIVTDILYVKQLEVSLRIILNNLAFSDIAQIRKFKIYIVDQESGWCNYAKKYVSIPLWALKERKQDYCTYYVAHELTHILTPWQKHNWKFYEELKRVCPKCCIHYELTYKP
jgi:predicted metal-dependent hydrolase